MTVATPTDAEIATSVTDIVAGELAIAPAELDPHADLRAIEGADSVKVLRIIARIEQRHDIELEDSDVFGVTTVDRITAVVAAAVRGTP